MFVQRWAVCVLKPTVEADTGLLYQNWSISLKLFNFFFFFVLWNLIFFLPQIQFQSWLFVPGSDIWYASSDNCSLLVAVGSILRLRIWSVRQHKWKHIKKKKNSLIHQVFFPCILQPVMISVIRNGRIMFSKRTDHVRSSLVTACSGLQRFYLGWSFVYIIVQGCKQKTQSSMHVK